MSTMEFDPSLLGTKDHWDERYADELAHFLDSGFEGEVWFGDEPVKKMIAWSLTHVPPVAHPNVLDVGTGNGHLLFALADAGYDASRLVGVDYSQGSVDLSIAIAKERNAGGNGAEHSCAYEDITFAVCDFLDAGSSMPLLPGQEGTGDGVWDLILDKGTFDAISLMEKGDRGISPLERYAPRVVQLLRPGGHFLITSCNFTGDELIQKIAVQESGLKHKGSISYKTFTFGGKSGSPYATVAFQKSLD